MMGMCGTCATSFTSLERLTSLTSRRQVVDATPGELLELREQLQPVYDQLHHDRLSSGFLQRLERLLDNPRELAD